MLTKIIRTSSIWYNFARQQTDWDKHNQIISGLFLGVIPTSSTSAGEYFSNSASHIILDIQQSNPTRPLGLVVSVVEPDELAGQGFAGVTMVSPEDWLENNIDHFLVEMKDFSATVDRDKAQSAILKMREVIQSGKSVYIHCKAGRSRSAMFCAIYLCLFQVNPDSGEKYTLNDAIQLIKNARKQICIEEAKKKLAQELIDEIRKNYSYSTKTEEKEEKQEEIPLTERLNDLLVLPSTKQYILNMPSISNLLDYAIETERAYINLPCNRTILLNELLTLIRKPHCEQWFYILYTTLNNPLARYMQATPILSLPPDDEPRKDKLRQAFTNEIMEYLITSLECSTESIMDIVYTPDSSWEIFSPSHLSTP